MKYYVEAKQGHRPTSRKDDKFIILGYRVISFALIFCFMLELSRKTHGCKPGFEN